MSHPATVARPGRKSAVDVALEVVWERLIDPILNRTNAHRRRMVEADFRVEVQRIREEVERRMHP